MAGQDQTVGAASVSAGGPGLDDRCEARATILIGSGMSEAVRPTGLALALKDDDRFWIEVTSDGDETCLALGPYREDEVTAVWRSLAGASGLPLTWRRPDGVVEKPFPQLGPVRLGARHERRRLTALTGRRPRFLVRRKASRLAPRPLVYREPEMVAGRDA